MEKYVNMLENFLSLKDEYEWLDFKENWFSKDEIGEYISAISNEAAEENENYILIGFADKIIWDYPSYESDTITRKQYTYSYINREVNISNELIWEGNLQMKYNPEIFFNNIEYVISYDDEPEIEIYDRHGNLYFLIAYKEFCDFYDKDGNYHKLESIRNIVDYVDISDIIDIHDYGLTPSIDYSRDIKEQTNVIDGKLTY